MISRRIVATVLVLTVSLPVSAADVPDPAHSPAAAAMFSDPNTRGSVVSGDDLQGDLSHIDYTATDPVPASLVFPSDGGYGGVATPFVVSTGRGGGVEISVNGDVVPPTHIGKQEVAKDTGETRYTFYGVGLVPGPNTVELTALGAGGRRFSTTRYTIFGRGPAVSLKSAMQGKLVADGRSQQVLRITAIDRWNHPAMAGLQVHASVLSGDLLFAPSVKPKSVSTGAASSLSDGRTSTQPVPGAVVLPSLPTSGPQVTSSSPPVGFAPQGQSAQIGTPSQGAYSGITDQDGGIDLVIVPGLRPGDALVRVSFDDDVSVDVPVDVVSYVRPVIVTGLVTGGVGAVPGDPGTDATAAYEANSRMGRIALFGTGQVGRDTSATVAYDTAGILDENGAYGSFDENPDDRPYLTYGDSSVRRADALSTNHLFARLNRGVSSIGYGEFQADTATDSPNSLGGFNLLLNGTQINVANKTTKIQVFGASVGVAYAREILSPSGLATVSNTLYPNIVVGSDSITLVTLDRHTGYVVSETALTRNIDYVLDYASGQIRFINPPLPFDDKFNPQQVLVQYEYQGNSGSFVLGGRGSTYVGALKLGFGYANESTGTGNIVLFGQNLASPFLGGTLRLEHLSSSGLVGEQIPTIGGSFSQQTSSGSAFRGNLTGTTGVAHYDLTYQSTSQGFNDPFAGIATPGLTSARFAVNRPLGAGDVALLIDAESNSVYGSKSSNTSASVSAHQRLGHRLKVTVSLTHRIVSSNGLSAPPNFLAVSQDATPGNPLGSVGSVALDTQTPLDQQRLGGSVTQAEIGATYDISPAVQLSLDRTSDIGGATLASESDPSDTSVQVTALLGKTGRAYLRELFTDQSTQSFAESTSNLTQSASSTRVTQIGIEKSLGLNTSVDTQYSIENTGSGSDIYSAIGVKQRILATRVLHGDVLVQRANAVGSGSQGFSLYGLNLAFTPGTSFRSTLSYEIRSGASPGSTFNAGAVGYVGSGVSLIASLDNQRTTGLSSTNDRFGLAFRPNDNDRSAALFGYQHIAGEGAVAGELTNVLSFDGIERPTTRLELSGRLAYKLDGDSLYYAAHSTLAGIRVLQRFGARTDIAGEVVASGVNGVDGSSVAGYAMEGGYRLGDQFRIAVGYNFQQTPDSSLAAPPRRKGFYFTGTSVMSSLFGLGRPK